MQVGAPWRICEEHLWRFGFAWFQRPWSIHRIHWIHWNDRCLWQFCRGQKEARFFMTKLQWCQALRVRRRFPWVSYIFLIMACPSTWYGHITQIPRIHVLMRFIRLSFLNCALFISNHTDQSHIRNFETSNYARTGRSCKAKCYLSKWWGLHHRQVLHLVHCLYCSHQISWACPWFSWCTSNCAWTKSSKNCMSRCPIVPLPPFLPWQNGPKKIRQECQTRFHSITPWAEPIWKSMNLPWSGRYWDSGPSVKLSHLHPTYPDLFECWEILWSKMQQTSKDMAHHPPKPCHHPYRTSGVQRRWANTWRKSLQISGSRWHMVTYDLFWCGNQELYCIYNIYIRYYLWLWMYNDKWMSERRRTSMSPWTGWRISKELACSCQINKSNFLKVFVSSNR